MLKDLDNVDWAQFGGEIDLRQWLLDFTSPDWETREKSMYAAEKVPPKAQPAIIPFMIEMICAPQMPDKAKPLFWLRGSACYPTGDDLEVEGPAFDPSVVEPTRAAVRAGIAAYIDCLTDADPWVRSQAAMLLGDLKARETVGALLAQLEAEQNPEVCVSILAGLRELDARESLPIVQRFLTTHDPLVRLEAAVTVSRLAGRGTPELALQVLMDKVIGSTRLEGLDFKAFNALEELGPEYVERGVDCWLEKLKAIPRQSAWAYLQMIFFLLFQELGRYPRPRKALAALNSLQRRFLKAVCNLPEFWNLPKMPREQDPKPSWGELEDLLWWQGLPNSRKELIRFLRSADPV
jgi:hypothetical protein